MGIEETFEIYPTGSGANLKATIARQAARKAPFVGYYWGPTEVIGKYKLKRLDMPAYDAAKFTCLTDTKCEAPAADRLGCRRSGGCRGDLAEGEGPCGCRLSVQDAVAQ